MAQATHARALPRSRALEREESVWGPVDVILALVLLPLALWVGAIDMVVRGIVWLMNAGRDLA